MAVADVKRFWGRDDAFRGTGLAADDEIVVANIQVLERHWHEREV